MAVGGSGVGYNSKVGVTGVGVNRFGGIGLLLPGLLAGLLVPGLLVPGLLVGLLVPGLLVTAAF